MGKRMHLLGATLALGLIMTPLRPAWAASAAEINRGATAALKKLYRGNESAKLIGEQAKAVLIFPSVGKAGFYESQVMRYV